MFQTRGDLKRRIRDLEEENAFLVNAQKLAENGGLAKCKSIVCKGCEHAVLLIGGMARLTLLAVI